MEFFTSTSKADTGIVVSEGGLLLFQCRTDIETPATFSLALSLPGPSTDQAQDRFTVLHRWQGDTLFAIDLPVNSKMKVDMVENTTGANVEVWAVQS